MSWGDQIMDEFGMVGEKKKSKLGMDRRKTLLAMFAMHIASKYSLPFDEAALDAEIDAFLASLDSEDSKKAKPEKARRSARPQHDEDEEVHYLG